MAATISHPSPMRGPWKTRQGDLSLSLFFFCEWLAVITYFSVVHNVRRKQLVKLVFLGTGSEISRFLHFWQSGWMILEGAVAAGLKRVPSCVVY